MAYPIAETHNQSLDAVIKRYSKLYGAAVGLLILLILVVLPHAYAEVDRTVRTDFGSGRWMESQAILEQDGDFTLHTTSAAESLIFGLSGHSVFAVILNQDDQPIWVSSEYRPKAVGSKTDISLASKRVQVFREKFPVAVVRHAKTIDIYQSDHDQASIVESLKEAATANRVGSKELAGIVDARSK